MYTKSMHEIKMLT